MALESRIYWKRREENAREKALQRDYSRSLEIKGIYQNMTAEIEKNINAFYQKYADKNGLSFADAKKKVSKVDIDEYSAKAKRYVDAAQKDFEKYKGDKAGLAKARERAKRTYLSETANQEMELYNLTMKVNRLEMLKAEIGLEMVKSYSEMEAYGLAELEAEALNEFTRQAGILGETVNGNARAAAALPDASYKEPSFYVPELGKEYDTFSSLIWTHYGELKANLDGLLSRALVNGEGANKLIADLRKATGASEFNARRLIVTETARVRTEVQKTALQQAGVVYYEYMALGANPCTDCADLDGQKFPVDDMKPGQNAPPMHPFCVLPDTKIIAPGLEAITKSYYSGIVFEFVLSDGRRLTVSPNHIMLTTRGWVRAKDILQADNVISYCGGVEPFLKGNPTNDNCIPTVEKVFTSLAETGGVLPARVPPAPEYLKGDVSGNSEIEIITINRKLWYKIDARKRQMLCNVGFIGTGKAGKMALNSCGTFAKCLITLGLAADRVVRGLNITPLLFWRAFRSSQLVSFRRAADYNARVSKTVSNNGTTNAEAFRKCINTFSGVVKVDNIVDINCSNFTGHVYDASSLTTLYTANGVITSNCHCATGAASNPNYDAWLSFLENGGTTEEFYNEDLYD